MRDQSERVAERVRALLRDHYGTVDDEPAERDGALDIGHDDGDEWLGTRWDETPRGAGDRAERGTPRHRPAESGHWRRVVERLTARLPVRVDPGRGAAVAVGFTVLVAALVTGAWVLVQRPRTAPVAATAPALPVSATPVGSEPARPSFAATSSTQTGSPTATTSTAVLVIDVAGRVRHPGVFRLPAGTRIDDAVRAAGGALPGVDLSGLNLAQKLADGQQILVGVHGGSGAVVGGASASGSASTQDSSPQDVGAAGAGTPVDLNTATLDQLQTLPGVGPVLGQRILDWRTQHGSFATVDQLDDVSGIGTVKFAGLKSLVTV